jgi:hypothetical protein
MICFAKANTKCGGRASSNGLHPVFALAKQIMIKVKLTVLTLGPSLTEALWGTPADATPAGLGSHRGR